MPPMPGAGSASGIPVPEGDEHVCVRSCRITKVANRYSIVRLEATVSFCPVSVRGMRLVSKIPRTLRGWAGGSVFGMP